MTTDSSEEPLFGRKKSTSDLSLHHGLFVLIYFSVVLTIGIVVRDYATPVNRGFFCDDESIRYPYKVEAVPDSALYSVTVIGAFAVICFVEAARMFCFEKRYFGKAVFTPEFAVLGYEVHPFIARCNYFLSAAAVAIATDVFIIHSAKQYAGRLRPHFIDICKPNWGKINCTDQNGYQTLVLNPFCTAGSVLDIYKAKKSWPSGHASLTAMAFVLLFIYLRARTPELKRHLYAPSAQLIIFMLMLMTCISRVDDNMHHPSDVISGLVIGTVEGLFFSILYGGFLELPDWMTKFQWDSLNRKARSYDPL